MEISLPELRWGLYSLMFFLASGLIAAFWGGLNTLESGELPVFEEEEEEESNGSLLRRAFRHPFRLLTTLLFSQLFLMFAGTVMLNFWLLEVLQRSGSPLLDSAVGFFFTEVAFLLVATPLVIFLFDFLPRTFTSSQPLVDRFSPLLWLVLTLTTPVSWLMRKVGGLFIREEEILELYHAKNLGFYRDVDRRTEEGLEEKEREMIANIFDFREHNVRDVMTPRIDVMAIDIGTEPSALLTILAKAPYSRFPVFEDDIDNVVGLLHIRDLLQPLRKGSLESIDLRSLLRDPVFVPETKMIDDLLRELKDKRTHMAVVLDEFGGTAGIVTIEDVLEEIVGQIQDEYDKEALPVYQTESGEYVISALLPLDDLNEIIGSSFEENEEYETVGGLVMESLGEIPDPEDSFVRDGYRFTVLNTEGNRIKQIRVREEPQDTLELTEETG